MRDKKECMYVASCSMGKDSVAMVLRLLEEGKPLDEVVYFDTGADFASIIENAVRMERILKNYGVKFVRLRPEHGFFELMTQKEVHKRDGTIQHGYSFCGGVCRWGTTLKTTAIKKHYQTLNTQKIVEYIGIAADELKRVGKSAGATGENVQKSYPLIEWGMTEKQCLKFCRAHGWTWKEDEIDLYDVFDRVSCWCCANKNLKELRGMYEHFPKYWKALKMLQNICATPYRKGTTLAELEARFEREIAERK